MSPSSCTNQRYAPRPSITDRRFPRLTDSQDQAHAALSMDKKDFGTSILAVELATHNATGPKRTATTRIKPASAASPPGDSPAAEDVPDDAVAASDDRAHNYKARSIALLELPDTVNDARVRALAEQVGPLTKVSLRPDKGGAIVEYRDVADVGRAELMLQGMEIDAGRKLRVGSVVELLKEGKAEHKEQTSSKGKASAGKSKDVALSMRPAARTGQQGPRRGGRGGLGFRKLDTGAIRSESKGGVDETRAAAAAAEEEARSMADESIGGSVHRNNDAEEAGSSAREQKSAKSNADFRAMLGA